jgi:hypothetical protein
VKQVEVATYDDLDHHEKDLKTRAARTVYVGLDGRWVELDLTDAHAAEAVELIGRYMAAGSKPDKPPAPGAAAGPNSGARARSKVRLAWLNAHGWPDLKAGDYLPIKAQRAYAEHLSTLAAVNGEEATADA